MTDGDLVVVSCKTPDERRRRVAVDQHEIGLDFFHDRIQSFQTARRDID